MVFNKELVAITIVVVLFLISVKADIRRDCRVQTRVSWASLKKVRKGDFSLDDRRLNCYLKCYMVRNGIINSNSEITIDTAMKMVPEGGQKTTNELFEKCRAIKDPNSCKQAFLIAKCFVKYHPQVLEEVAFV